MSIAPGNWLHLAKQQYPAFLCTLSPEGVGIAARLGTIRVDFLSRLSGTQQLPVQLTVVYGLVSVTGEIIEDILQSSV